jgi:hypothetical protein
MKHIQKYKKKLLLLTAYLILCIYFWISCITCQSFLSGLKSIFESMNVDVPKWEIYALMVIEKLTIDFSSFQSTLLSYFVIALMIVLTLSGGYYIWNNPSKQQTRTILILLHLVGSIMLLLVLSSLLPMGNFVIGLPPS